jgi:hypothetical protein
MSRHPAEDKHLRLQLMQQNLLKLWFHFRSNRDFYLVDVVAWDIDFWKYTLTIFECWGFQCSDVTKCAAVLRDKKLTKKKAKLRGLSPRTNYTDRATAACREVIANFCG